MALTSSATVRLHRHGGRLERSLQIADHSDPITKSQLILSGTVAFGQSSGVGCQSSGKIKAGPSNQSDPFNLWSW